MSTLYMNDKPTSWVTAGESLARVNGQEPDASCVSNSVAVRLELT